MQLVSIIIPVYNAAGFLSKTIASVINQTYPNIEIIIVDDESSDNSFEIAKSYEKDTIKVVRQKNAGAAMARNKGISIAQGTYFQFLDAGDIISEDKIEKQVAALNGSLSKLAVSNYIKFYNETDLLNPVRQDQSSFIYSTDDTVDFLINLFGGKGNSNFIQTNCWLVPSALVSNFGNWRNYRCPDDDGEFFTRMILGSSGIIYVPDVVNYYFMDPAANQLSSNRNYKYLLNSLLTIDLKYKYLSSKRFHPDFKKAIATQYLHFAVYNYPYEKKLSAIAFRKYKALNEKVPLPIMGGKVFYIIAQLFGWKISRICRSLLRE